VRHLTQVALSWSGGKDSTLALERLKADPNVHVVALVTTVSMTYDRVSIHGFRRSILHRQSRALGIPLTEIPVEPGATNADYESAFAAGLTALRARNAELDHIAFGDLFLEDVRKYRDRMLTRLGWTGVYPIWSEPTDEMAMHFIRRGYRAHLTCVDTTQLDAKFAGRVFDDALLGDLPAGVDPCGENGEFHTCVVSGPLFTEPIAVVTGERVLRDGQFQYCDLEIVE
jgi:uncharacterized protein (TIGR00290 family)